MQRSKTCVALLLAVTLAAGLVSLGFAGEAEKPYRIKPQPKVPLKEYEGQIKAVKIEKCGLQPGTCEGSIILATKGGGEIALAIKPGTWIRRGGDAVLIDELGVGNYIKVRALKLEPEPTERVTIIDISGE